MYTLVRLPFSGHARVPHATDLDSRLPYVIGGTSYDAAPRSATWRCGGRATRLSPVATMHDHEHGLITLTTNNIVDAHGNAR